MDNRDQIEQIKSKLGILDVVQQYVPNLKKSGRNYFGLCPFHKEKTPSFSVNTELGLYKCFGCGEGGDVLKFIEKIEGLDFPKTLEFAAKKAGITLRRTYSPERAKLRAEKETLWEVNKLASEYYNYILLNHKNGESGRRYAKKRQLKPEILKKFYIGYAPRAYYNLKNFFLKKGYKEQDIVKWGLAVVKDGRRSIDKFRERFIFPIRNAMGDYIGFTGRTIDPESLGPKYLNSPETAVYKKSEVLYGLFEAKEAIRKNDYVIIVEGNIDILTSHQVGIENIVAPMGTALTFEQVRLLKRYTNKIYFALDTDMAGQKALLKALELCEKEGMTSYIIDLEHYKDVDELITSGGDWKRKVDEPKEFVLYFIEKLRDNYDFSKPTEKSRYAISILKLINRVSDNLLKSEYIQLLSDKTNIGPDILGSELGKMAKIETSNSRQAVQGQIIDSRLSEIDTLTRYFLALLVNHPKWRENFATKNLHIFYNQEYKNVFKAVLDSKFRDKLSRDEFEIFTDVSLMQIGEFLSPDDFKKELLQVYNRLMRELIKSSIAQLKFQMRTGAGSEDELLNKVNEKLHELAEYK